MDKKKTARDLARISFNEYDQLLRQRHTKKDEDCIINNFLRSLRELIDEGRGEKKEKRGRWHLRPDYNNHKPTGIDRQKMERHEELISNGGYNNCYDKTTRALDETGIK